MLSRASNLRRMAYACALVILCIQAAAFAQSPDPMLGQSIATQGTAQGATACASCHGASGEGNSAAGFPRLAGLGRAYLLEQLNAFAAGYRKSAVMHPIAKALTAPERAAVALHFSKLASPLPSRINDQEDVSPNDIGAWLATRGRWNEGVPACVQCHGPGGAGIGENFPPLAGQPVAYLESQLHDWKKGLRPPGPFALMVVIAGKLSDGDISAVAKYYAELTAKAAVASGAKGESK